ncbi:hypothetical protein TeGR_g14379 [Tetraparma gracilis]|uniref:Epidermal growth factor-like domain-containing protein n=1 Tax=Tetraparma gracilis TaxID=2962635 RepID=A0ABQ6MPK3_9STRA|nr:hypothetical protein TeGR_g14379 [Tetraparma gracilis]
MGKAITKMGKTSADINRAPSDAGVVARTAADSPLGKAVRAVAKTVTDSPLGKAARTVTNTAKDSPLGKASRSIATGNSSTGHHGGEVEGAWGMATTKIDISADRCLAFFWHHMSHVTNTEFEKKNGGLLKMQVDVPDSHSSFMVASFKIPFPGVDNRLSLSTMRKRFDKSPAIDAASNLRLVDMIQNHDGDYSEKEEEILEEGRKMRGVFEQQKSKELKMASPTTQAKMAFKNGESLVYGWSSAVVRASPAQVLAYTWDFTKRAGMYEDDMEKMADEDEEHNKLTYVWFRPMMDTIAQRLLESVSWGLKMRLYTGAGLSTLDLLTDLYMIKTSHGKCVSGACVCDDGFSGADCGTVKLQPSPSRDPSAKTLTIHSPPKMRPLSIGHATITTRKELSALVKPGSCTNLLIGFSAPTSRCAHCGLGFEEEYEVLMRDALFSSPNPSVKFVRVDRSTHPEAVPHPDPHLELPPPIPYMQYYDCATKKHNVMLLSEHATNKIVAYLKKRQGPPVLHQPTLERATDYVRATTFSAESKVTVMGVFGDLDAQEDEYEDFVEYCALEVHPSMDRLCVAVIGVGPPAPDEQRHFPRTPAAVVYRPGNDANLMKYVSANTIGDTAFAAAQKEQTEFHHEHYLLDELSDLALRDFVLDASVPDVAYLTTQVNDALVARRKPILMVFIDEKNPRSMSGGIYNPLLYAELLALSRNSGGDVMSQFSIVLADGNAQRDHMALLDIRGGVDALPAVAINGNDARVACMDPDVPVNSDTMLAFAASHLKGTLRNGTSKLVRGAAAKNPRNKPERGGGGKGPATELVQGVAEKLDGAADAEYGIEKLSPEAFDSGGKGKGGRMLVMFHRGEGCDACDHLNVYYKHAALQLSTNAASATSVAVARVDLDEPEWSAGGGGGGGRIVARLELGTLPVVALFGAPGQGDAPLYYTGLGKTEEMMEWVGRVLGLALGELPHLTETEKMVYREQLGLREARRMARARGEQAEL